MPVHKMTDRGVRPPTLIGKFCRVNEPGRVVGKIRPQKEKSGQAQKGSQKKQNPMQLAFREISPG